MTKINFIKEVNGNYTSTLEIYKNKGVLKNFFIKKISTILFLRKIQIVFFIFLIFF